MRIVMQHMTSDGIGTGVTNFNGDYSVTPAYPKIQPLTSEIFEIHTVSAYIRDVGTTLEPDEFGAGSALTNGVTLEKVTGTTVVADFTLGDPIVDNGGFAHFATYYKAERATGGGDSLLVARWEFDELFDRAIRLDGRNLEALRVTLNDSMTGLGELEFVAFGHTVVFDNTEQSI